MAWLETAQPQQLADSKVWRKELKASWEGGCHCWSDARFSEEQVFVCRSLLFRRVLVIQSLILCFFLVGIERDAVSTFTKYISPDAAKPIPVTEAMRNDIVGKTAFCLLILELPHNDLFLESSESRASVS